MTDDPLSKWLVVFLLAVTVISFTGKKDHIAGATIHEDNYIIAQAPHSVNKYITLASKIDRIIFCESTYNAEAKNPKSSAYGLCQFTDNTWKYVQDKWKMELDRNSESDQYYACKRLYEEEGIGHWLESQPCHRIYE